MDGYRFCPQCGSGLVDRNTGVVSRPACPAEACGFVLWDNPVPVIAAIVEYSGRIVLARNVAWPEKVFGLVTGYLERDEAPEAAVAREVGEELGLRATSVRLVGLYPFAEKNQLIVAYHVIADGRIDLNEELAEVRLIDPDKLKAWDFGTGPAVRDWLATRAAA
ncbi:MAG: NUDIX domain-containing protein [Dechloromonas sp.]|nr:NUDIX domain-containing protein [Dechloromonas sp.]